MTALSCSLGSWHQPRTGAGAAGGRTRTVLVSVASRLVSPWSVLAVLLGSPGLQISRLPVLSQFFCQELSQFPTLACVIHLAVQWLCQLLAASFPSLFAVWSLLCLLWLMKGVPV